MSEESDKSSVLANLKTQWKMALALGSLILLLLVGTVSSLLSQRETEDARDWVLHTHDALNEIDNVEIAVLEQETGVRGYVISGQADFLESYRTGYQHYGEGLSNLREMTRDNPDQQQRLDDIERSAQEWRQAFIEPVLGWVDNADTRAQAIDMITRGEGKRRTDHIMVILHDMEESERVLLKKREQTSADYARTSFALSLGLIAAGILLGALALFTSSRLITRPLREITSLMSRLAGGDREIEVPGIRRKDEIGELARALAVFKQMTIDIFNANWTKTQVGELSGKLQSAVTQQQFGETLMSNLTPQLGAALGLFYQVQDDGSLLMSATYGFRERRDLPRSYKQGEGLVGQCARQGKPIVLTDVPADYLRIHSALGESAPRTLILLPVTIKERVVGVLEFGTFTGFNDLQRSLLDELMPILALTLENLSRALKTQLLLEETQAQAEELTASEESLRAQQEELRVTNEQLEQQGRQLRASEEELRVQAEELKVANEEMQAKTETLNQQKDLLEKLQQETEQKAEDLAQASRYKSEFLANMSHELRTPLNSMLILSKSLADNEGGNLDNDQQEAARIINDSGHNLLRLINDILDLSKVEAGKMEVYVEQVELRAFSTGIDRTFRHVARERSLEFRIDVAPDLPPAIEQDGAKINQIVTNLLSNAFKFTARGSVVLSVSRPQESELIPGVDAGHTVCFRVTDSGIGIPAEKLQRIFGAFEQVDGTTSRKYGGTGLGLSISRSMAELLGGRISVRSVEGESSTFILSLPQTLDKAAAVRAPAARRAPAVSAARPAPGVPAAPVAVTLPDPPPDSGKPLILVIEDDPNFSKILADAIRKRGCEAITAGDGESGFAAAEKYKPTGIILDVALPGMDGWSVMERLKANAETRHIPVHFMSAVDDTLRGLGMGAVGYMVKPVSREGINAAFDKVLHFAKGRPRKLLLVDDDKGSRVAVHTLIDMPDVEIVEAQDGAQGLSQLKQGGYDCLILDLMLPDMDGLEFLKRATQEGPIPPVVIYSAKTLSADETAKLRQYTDSIVIKSARSPERLLDEVTLFLHSIRDAHTPAAKVERAANTDLSGKTALIVDDDMRNVFALSRVLRTRGLNVVMAEDGYKAIAQLEQNKLIDIVLMDIMMPGMDGYATMREIRKRGEWQKLPIIAVSAKAMRGDREKCIEAGANDYLSKPIDIDKLVSMMRVFL